MESKCRLLVKMLFLLLLLASAGCTFQVINPPPPIEVAFKSAHGRYVTAQDAIQGWAIGQEAELSECSWFTQQYLANGKIALKTCHNQYIVAPQTGVEKEDWLLGQTSRLSECTQFDLYELGKNRVALKTCAGRFWTAGDGAWPGDLAWTLVGETVEMNTWEVFTIQQR